MIWEGPYFRRTFECRKLGVFFFFGMFKDRIQDLQSDPFEMVKWPLLGLSDLELMVDRWSLWRPRICLISHCGPLNMFESVWIIALVRSPWLLLPNVWWFIPISSLYEMIPWWIPCIEYMLLGQQRLDTFLYFHLLWLVVWLPSILFSH